MPVFVIAPLLLKPADESAVKLLRRSYDPHADLVEPHVTLMFGVDDGLEGEAMRWARIHAASVEPGSLRFTLATVVRGQENAAWYLFLLPREVPAGLAELHRKLNAGPLAEAPDVGFDAHLTLGQFDRRVLAEAVARDCNARAVAIEARFEALDVLLFDGATVRSRHRIPLGRRE